MWLATLLLALAGLSLAQMAAIDNCAPLTSSNPPCTLAFTPFMAPQIRPTSTVYKAMATNHMNIIDCRLCTIVQVDSNAPAIGPFTTKVTREVLTVTRVGCMVDSTAITRRDVRGYTAVEEAQSTLTEMAVPEIRLAERLDHSVKARDGLLLSQLSVDELADIIVDSIDPGNPDLRQQATIYIRQLRSARFAVDLIDSGFELKSLCNQSRTPTVRVRWTDQGYDATRVSNLLCFASVNGLPLNTSYNELQEQFFGTIAALQYLSGPNANITEACERVSLPFAEPLHIDGSGIKAYICSNGTTTSLPSSSVPPSTSKFPTTTVSVGTIPTFVTGDAGPWANSTGWSWAGTGTAGHFSIATGEPRPWLNSTGEVSRGSAGPTGTGNGNWTQSINLTFATWSVASGSWWNSSVETVTGFLGATQGTATSWIGATVTGQRPNSGDAVSSATGGSWTISGTAPPPRDSAWGTGSSVTAQSGIWQMNGTTTVPAGSVWATGDTWTSQGDSFGSNSTAIAVTGTEFANTGSMWGTGGAWGFNGTEATASTAGWATRASWTVIGGSWPTGNTSLGSNVTGIWGTGGPTTIAVTGTPGVFSIATANATVGIQNGTHVPLALTSSRGYPSWTTSTVSGTVFRKH